MAVAVTAGPMARFEALKADEGAQDEIFRLLCEGLTLAQIAKEWGLPKHRFSDWMLTEKPDVLARARAALTDEFICELVPLLRSVTPETASQVKTQVDGFLKLASKWDRPRYGEHVKAERIEAGADAAALLTAATELLREIKKPAAVSVLPKVVEGEVLPA